MKLNEPFNDSIFFKHKGVYRKTGMEEILYLKANGDYISCHLADKQYTFRSSLGKMVELLPEAIFLRVHRSYIIQMDKIEEIDFQDSTVLIAGQVIPLNRDSRKKLMSYITKLE